ncbi:uncharacterized protein [Nicotiana tomentosiformis]|uniref:uncharacterized protein n=1 Tax=Nicotiana tomentosiformis TaxID=4098 RepID=UPI00388C5001
MADNTINNMHYPEIRGDQPYFEDSISDTHNEENGATPVHDRQYPRHVRETTPDDADEEHVVDAVRVLQEQQAIILGHLTRHDKVMTELKQALSRASNNANRRDPIPLGFPANQTTQRVDNNTPRGEIGSDGARGNGSGLNDENDPFTNELLRFIRFMRKVNACMDQIPGVPPVLKGPVSKKYTQLLYNPIAALELIPKRFKMPEVPKYDGTSDPQEHITTYITAVKENGLAPQEIESVLLKKFGETLTGEALTWFSLLLEHSIDSFEMLAVSFIKAHAKARKVQAQKDDIFKIAQGESELLREFVTQFQKERMLLPAVPDKWAAEAFTKGLNPSSSDASRQLKERLLEFQAMTWADVHNRYESKIRIEDDHVGFPSSTKGREKNREKSKDDYGADKGSLRGRCLPYERTEGRNRGFRTADRFAIDRRTDRGPNNQSLQDKEASGSQDPFYPKLSEYNFNVSIVELVSAMRNIKEAQFMKPMRSDPSQRDPNLWCEYHGMNGHRTGDC